MSRDFPKPVVAALFVERGGVYWDDERIDPWDEARDARLYAGPLPVIAHPPCGRWSPIAYINEKRLPGYKIGDDGGCFATALNAVRSWGGVLEHPAGSLAWKHFGLAHPVRGGWAGKLGDLGWVTEVDQGAYGHRARKRTWLYYYSTQTWPDLPDFDWTPARSDVWISGFLHRTGTDESRRVRPREAAATPPSFREALISIALSARPEPQPTPQGGGAA